MVELHPKSRICVKRILWSGKKNCISSFFPITSFVFFIKVLNAKYVFQWFSNFKPKPFLMWKFVIYIELRIKSLSALKIVSLNCGNGNIHGIRYNSLTNLMNQITEYIFIFFAYLKFLLILKFSNIHTLACKSLGCLVLSFT